MASTKRTAAPKTTTPTTSKGTASKTKPVAAAPTREQIERRAYEIWRSRNGVGGNAGDDWAQAERELRFELTPPVW